MGRSVEIPLIPSVLHIEDDPVSRLLVARLLKRRDGIELLSAPDGRTGLDLAAARRPRIILLDLHLPDLSGEDVLRLLREDETTSSIPVVVTSADSSAQRVARLLAGGASCYLTKPVDLDRILQLVDANV